jgi:hypothetical protein
MTIDDFYITVMNKLDVEIRSKSAVDKNKTLITLGGFH